MAGRFNGKVAIVSGAGSSGPGYGVGKATSVLLADEGARLVLVDNVEERAKQTQVIIEERGAESVVVAADVTDPGSCQLIAERALSNFGRIDVLVNVAAIAPMVALLETDSDLYDRVLALNTKAPFMLSKAVIPAMISGGGGAIANITSLVAIRSAGTSQAAYSTSKAALLGMMTDIACTYGRQGIRINCVLPGQIATPMRDTAAAELGLDPSTIDMGDRTALGFEGDAWDIARATAFLCSDDARYITGVHLAVDGGASLRSP